MKGRDPYMTDEIKNSAVNQDTPGAVQKSGMVSRVLIIVIIGTIAFGVLFNWLTGGGNMDHMGNMSGMGGYGTSLDTFLGGLLILLVKLFMVVLVIAVIIGIGVWIKNTFQDAWRGMQQSETTSFKNAKPNQLFQTISSDPILKTVSVITIAVIGVILLLSLLGSFTGLSLGLGGSMGGHGGMIGGFSAALSIAGLLTLLIKVLSFVLVISLILALAAYIKKQADQGAFNFTKTNAQGTPNGTNTPANNQLGSMASSAAERNDQPGDNTENG
ncbi:MAG: hypothetical protein N2645_06610 [Clostridia bacterium]|nr:hypothetical protein [Clostridia bacterium]